MVSQDLAMSNYPLMKVQLKSAPKSWLITGLQCLSRSNLLEHLLYLDQIIVGLDNSATGCRRNFNVVQCLVTETH